MNYKYVSVYEIIEGVYRDSGIQEELDIWDVIEWSGEALELIGAGVSYVNLVGEICLKDHRAKLPCNFHTLEQISYNGSPLPLCSGTFGAISTSASNTTTNYIDGKKVDSENFPTSDLNTGNRGNCYYINDNFVVTSFATGCLLLAFKGVKVDKEGFPMIPDNVSYKKAIKSYIQTMVDRIWWRRGSLSEAVYRDSQQDWEWYVKQARGSISMPNLDQMENIKNQWVRLKPNINSSKTFFTDLANPEHRKLK
jgi:hypothetical protein|tara:strand:- start:331 stop:1086 length:756 start_codon:yes stop_codon:yes gene_type:complete